MTISLSAFIAGLAKIKLRGNDSIAARTISLSPCNDSSAYWSAEPIAATAASTTSRSLRNSSRTYRRANPARETAAITNSLLCCSRSLPNSTARGFVGTAARTTSGSSRSSSLHAPRGPPLKPLIAKKAPPMVTAINADSRSPRSCSLPLAKAFRTSVIAVDCRNPSQQVFKSSSVCCAKSKNCCFSCRNVSDADGPAAPGYSA
mmetsp:Transcript_57022/g.121170  ORF Transcript_57022/g.121170 Transcript_57022/m.121170 type:complete len:204 (-) Transcript_57022:233-844(-)